MEEYNNLFNFATKELSQDAFICWALNWANYPDAELKGLAIDLFKLFGIKDFNPNQEITIATQIENADIVVALHGQKIILIIEDKTYTTEHDEQISKYRRVFSKNEAQKILGIAPGECYTDIRTVYLKTGFYYDIDRMVQADVKIDGQHFLSALCQKGYNEKSEILDSYREYLRKVVDDSFYYSSFDNKYPDGSFFLSWRKEAQHELMRSFFPKERWDGRSLSYRVRNGSSSGRPWTELNICEKRFYPESDDWYEFFWRIDTNKKGPYLSLRYYEWIEKEDRSINSERKKRHKEYFDRFLAICKSVVDEKEKQTGIGWSAIKDSYAGNYMESSLLSISLKDYLSTRWEDNYKLEKLIEGVRVLSDAIWEELKRTD